MLDANRDAVVAEYRKGTSTVKLGKIYGCNNGGVFVALQRWGEPIRQTKVLDQNRGAILAMHAKGVSAYRIDRELGIGKGTAERAIKQAGGDISHRQWRRDDPLVDHTEEIIVRYESGEGSGVIANRFGCRDTAILKLLKKNGIERRGIRDYAYPVDEAFFDVIDTEEKAYCLGFWYADGCNMPQVPAVRISITDADILFEMMNAMKFEGPIRTIPPRKKGHLPQYCVGIGSRHMSDALVRLGCVRKKTYYAEFPTPSQVPPTLQRHFVRGLSDGDGTITCSKLKNDKRRWHSRIVGTQGICEGLTSAVLRLGIISSAYPVHKSKTGRKHITYGFTVYDREHLKTYLDWLYRDATIYLKRKYDKYQEFLRASDGVFNSDLNIGVKPCLLPVATFTTSCL